MDRKNSWLAIILFCILLAGYFLFFRGVPSTDDEQLFASAAQNLAITGHFSALILDFLKSPGLDYHLSAFQSVGHLFFTPL
jgi:hypothetical protein